jgi:hypothetical protein
MKKALLLISAMLVLLAPLAAQSITVISPNGGEKMALGDTWQIVWTASANVSGNVKIQLIRPGGAIVGVIAANLSPLGLHHDWAVGQTNKGTAAPGDYKIRVMASDGSASDISDKAFVIQAAGSQPVVLHAPHEKLPPLGIFKAPKLEVSGIGLAPNAEGFAIIFSYKNVGNASLPKASEVPVKPDYRVLFGSKTMAQGSLFIPAFPAPPGWEQWGYYGGQVVFPDQPAPGSIYDVDANLFNPLTFGNEITVLINENKVMGMGSHQMVRKLETMAYEYYYDLKLQNVWYVWNTRMLNIVVKLDGKIPENGKFDLVCKTSVLNNNVFQTEQRRFHIVQAMDNRLFSFSKKVDLPDQPVQVKFIVYVIGNCAGSRQQKVCDLDMANNRRILYCRPGDECRVP